MSTLASTVRPARTIALCMRTASMVGLGVEAWIELCPGPGGRGRVTCRCVGANIGVGARQPTRGPATERGSGNELSTDHAFFAPNGSPTGFASGFLFRSAAVLVRLSNDLGSLVVVLDIAQVEEILATLDSQFVSDFMIGLRLFHTNAESVDRGCGP